MESTYPPELSSPQLDYLLSEVKDWSLAHGLAVRPPPTVVRPEADPGKTLALTAPVTLFPSSFPRQCFQEARAIQHAYNELYSRISMDEEWLGSIIEEFLEVDDFIAKLWQTHLSVKKEGYAQDVALGLFRSDYMVHLESSREDSSPELKQVEFNTIASSFGGLSARVSEMHRHLCAISAYPSERGFDLSRIPANASVAALAAGLATAHKAYGTHKGGSKLPTCVLMLVQDEERNVFDQRHLEYELLERHQVPMFRLPFSRITQETDAHDAADRALIFRPPHGTQAYEVSVVYFRAGYSPDDYQDAIPAWIGRYRIERSAAIKCPSVLTHLAGCKKIQQVLASPSSALLERFLPHHTSMRERVRQTFTSIYPLDDSAAGRKARRLALDPVTAQHYVLKPQREGGGNNIYRGKIPAFLRALPQSRWKGYILMEIIEPPPARNTILRNGRLETGAVISELGVYGVCLWRQPWRASLPQDSSRSAHDDDDGVRHTDDDDGEILYNDEAGYLLRTKGSATEEGGIAAGFGCVDSCWLVDS